MLAKIAKSSPRIIAIGFHVDYFDKPWKDPFSDPKHSRRQQAYNRIYDKPKNPDYGLYYTPMMMFNGVEATSGTSDNARYVEAAARRALERPADATLDMELKPGADERTATLELRSTPKTAKARGRKLLLGAVIREEPVVTKVRSGENGGRTLTEHFAVRKFLFEEAAFASDASVKSRSDAVSKTFDLKLAPSWALKKISVAAFVQDIENGEILQADALAWPFLKG